MISNFRPEAGKRKPFLSIVIENSYTTNQSIISHESFISIYKIGPSQLIFGGVFTSLFTLVKFIKFINELILRTILF